MLERLHFISYCIVLLIPNIVKHRLNVFPAESQGLFWGSGDLCSPAGRGGAAAVAQGRREASCSAAVEAAAVCSLQRGCPAPACPRLPSQGHRQRQQGHTSVVVLLGSGCGQNLIMRSKSNTMAKISFDVILFPMFPLQATPAVSEAGVAAWVDCRRPCRLQSLHPPPLA